MASIARSTVTQTYFADCGGVGWRLFGTRGGAPVSSYIYLDDVYTELVTKEYRFLLLGRSR